MANEEAKPKCEEYITVNNLLILDNVSLSLGFKVLLDKARLQIAAGERVCLIGRNGAGKSTLLKIVEGVVLPDSGQIWRKPGLKISRLEQDLPFTTAVSVYEFVAEGLAEMGELLAKYHALTQKFTHSNDNASDFAELSRLQNSIDAVHGWQFEQIIKNVLVRLNLEPDQVVSELSGGWQRRAALARALVNSPELLLLDEPTNHLDIDTIQWLEDFLRSLNIGLLFITHDRALLQHLATRIIELDRGSLTSWSGDYANFLRRKEEMLHAEEMQNKEFDKKLAAEEVWIRQGVKARRTRNEGRVRALEALRLERAKRRELEGKVTLNINKAAMSGQLVVEAKNINHAFGASPVIKNFSIRIMRGDRIGLIGPNGVGKSTLLNILFGKIIPDKGTVIQGTKLEVAYFDQLRQTLELDKTVIENVGHGSDIIEIDGKKQHVISYLANFLFTPEQALSKVKALSGGERNRLLLARLFSLPSNVMVLDEPTNDLDLETLELLEDLLANYHGTLLLVSHDRAFLDNIVTSSLVFFGSGKIEEYIGGYSDWQKQLKSESSTKSPVVKAKTEKITVAAKSESESKINKKLSYKEQYELSNLPKLIESLEAEKTELEHIVGDPGFYKQDAKVVAETLNKLKKVLVDIDAAYTRWEELEGIACSI